MVTLSAHALSKNYIHHPSACLLVIYSHSHFISYTPLTFFTGTLPLQACGEFLANSQEM